MRHITRLRIRDFQNHRDTDLMLTPGINLITGSSDAGKSAILRALNAVLHNDWPRGGSYVRRGAPHAEITVEYSDGTTVTRVKSGAHNSVTVTWPPADGTEPVIEGEVGRTPQERTAQYEGFGTALPPEVLLALGSPPFGEDGDGISYAEQLAPYFLVSLSANKLPRAISRLTGISEIEEAVDLLASDKREAKRKADDHERRVRDLEARLEPFSTLEARLDALAGLKARRDAVRGKGDAIAGGRALEQRLAALQRQQDAWEAGLQAAQRQCTGAILTKRDAARDLKDRIAEGRTLLTGHVELAQKRRELEDECQRSEDALRRLSGERQELQARLKEAGWWCAACDRPAPPRAPHAPQEVPAP